MNIKKSIDEMCNRALSSRLHIGDYNIRKKNAMLRNLCQLITKYQADIITRNQKDLIIAKKKKLSESFIDRMTLTPERVESMVNCIKHIVKLPDPLYKKTKAIKLENGIHLSQMRVPLGTIAIVYESRPNVTIDAACLCLKSGNSVILKGGSDTLNTNQYLVDLIKHALKKEGMSEDLVQLVKTTNRDALRYLLKKRDHIDVVIPRGGKSLIEMIMQESKIPMIKHLDGNCHVFIDRKADHKIAFDVSLNSKIQRLGVCNAIETLLIHEKYSVKKLKEILSALSDAGIELRGCKKINKIFSKSKQAKESDWYREYLGPILAVKIVESLDDAISHITKYGSMHTDAIISKDKDSINRFMQNVDSSSVMINTSTRFADGFEYGFGAEIGISTDKLHARGPVGLIGLTNQKYIVTSKGKTRQ